jgi:hypothetical protein
MSSDPFGVADSMRGRRISQVRYYGLYLLSETAADWDFGDWHHPLMGVELVLEPEDPYSVIWSSTFAQYDLGIFHSPMTRHHVGVGEPEGPPVHEVSRHPSWARLLAGPLLDVELLWLEHLDRSVRAPVAARLEFSAGNAWLVAAQPMTPGHDANFWVGSDEVIVTFADEFISARLGLPL